MNPYLPSIFGDTLMDAFHGFDRDFFRAFGQPERALHMRNAQHAMKTDVRETEEGYEVDIDLPGFRKDEIRLELENGFLTVTAKKETDEKEEDPKGRIIRQERYSGTMQRGFYVGDDLTEEQVKASFENGVLHLQLPKDEQPKVPEKKMIHIEG